MNYNTTAASLLSCNSPPIVSCCPPYEETHRKGILAHVVWASQLDISKATTTSENVFLRFLCGQAYDYRVSGWDKKCHCGHH
jgi:hypothetical protein